MPIDLHGGMPEKNLAFECDWNASVKGPQENVSTHGYFGLNDCPYTGRKLSIKPYRRQPIVSQVAAGCLPFGLFQHKNQRTHA